MCDDCNHINYDNYLKERIDEMTYKDIKNVINPRDLPHRDYAPLLKNVNFRGIKKDILRFFVKNKYNGWYTFFKFSEWDNVVNDTSLTAVEASRLLLWSSDIQLHCECPSFKFWGYQYILSQLDASIIPEKRFPHIRNPNLKGICCKHLRRAILVMPAYLGDISFEINRQRKALGLDVRTEPNQANLITHRGFTRRGK